MYWDNINEQEKRIQKVIQNLKTESDIQDAWLSHTQHVVAFPFKAKVVESQEPDSIIQEGDVLNVHMLDFIDDKYGIIANSRLSRKKILIPLCELDAVALNEEGKNAIMDYATWFANR
ncbi:calcium-binding protein [Sporolactobacillus nakayamae]|uniref:Calcium binding n=1 Tax=Sporolactobacillus nakayamae TaxID=269670 RepID=A0A1I2UXF6_9BACL|nr:calcium-binding protein [Sporolactobacillus nakayamae]SFG79576.1 Calcium binding [Sporolactobacillus nakayamae]